MNSNPYSQAPPPRRVSVETGMTVIETRFGFGLDDPKAALSLGSIPPPLTSHPNPHTHPTLWRVAQPLISPCSASGFGKGHSQICC